MEPRFCTQWYSRRKRSGLFTKLNWKLRWCTYFKSLDRSRVRVALFESKESGNCFCHLGPTGCWRYRRYDESSPPRVPDESRFLSKAGQRLEEMNLILTFQKFEFPSLIVLLARKALTKFPSNGIYSEALPILTSNTLVFHDPKQFHFLLHHPP